MENNLSICTVSYGHKKLIENNIKLFKVKNPDQLVNWIIVENSPQNQERFPIGKEGNVQVLDAVERVPSRIAVGSYHHGAGLNKAIKEVKTRFVLILDPDFFIIRDNWAVEIINHMINNNLTFFGAPYNPKRYLKYRYFPCIHCMFIDLKRVKMKDLNFLPQYV